ncbi:MAG: hypothetical protein CUN49_04730 [Candidatus Thermofonsia Clade 1 bacterium]|jgi:hypothetical protein|uniref:PPM-type phosphatase domain-containing protein n=1 Tax=Candidatus Thermofonsia Clade 1 bacterium TaxID=2364210 RepID=A0A2M8PG91_9CHLR|nr:MAG: hypothetical protein CUN49_04730 [Candidatus Thermofonsia Clade 1 bacterium]
MKMLETIEALVGYLFVVGGRAIGATPPGALVELPPRKVQRSREGDTFFTLITPYGKTHATANIYEALTHLAAEVYFRSSGSLTSALREAIHVVNSQISETGQRYTLNMICAVLRGNEVYLARTAESVCILRQNGDFAYYPDQLSEGVPLGATPSPEIKLSRCEVAPGDLMVLCDRALACAERAALNAALALPDLPAILEPLKALASRDTQALIVQFATPETPDPTPIPKPRKNTPPPETAPDNPVAQPSDSAPAPETPQSAASAAEQALEPAAPIGQRAALATSKALSSFAKGLSRALNRLWPEPSEAGAPRIPTMLAAILAILIPIVVVFVMVALQLSQFDLTQFEQMVRDVETAVRQAELVDLQDERLARTVWLGILERVTYVETTSGRLNDPTLNRVRAKAQSILDRFDKVTRRTPTPLRNFGEGAQLVGPIVRGGADIYTLDSSRSAIYRDTLAPEINMLITRNTQPVVQRGQAVSAFSVRDVVDMVWLAEGGVQRANVLAALDTQGILITYSPTFAPATAQRLAGADLWSKPIALATWRGNLYLLDPEANQIWRYRPLGNSYPNPPEEYFDGEVRPDLSTAVDLGIDPNGNVYIFFADGQLRKFTSGIEQRFALSGMPSDGLKSGRAMYLDGDSPLPSIYLLDSADQSIYQVTLSGAFRYRFRANDPNLFRALSGIYADRDNIFVASGSVLYHFSIADLAGQPAP